ncbi:MAG TPA: sugar phosphate nucleotidyltransferase, partial [Clostridia bacterium]|nr:sugar phosphate nucleotidyltransferase [Clostridia bacterium]
LTKTFVVISGDALTDIDLTEVFSFHKSKKSLLTIVLKRVDTPLEYGVVIANNDGKIERFLEKPSWGEVFSDTVNTGIYVIEPEVLDMIPEGKPYDFSRDLFPAMMAKGIDIYGYTAQGYWCDIGDAGQYMRSHIDILDDKVKIDIKAERREGNVYIRDNAVIEDGAVIAGPCFIGSGSVIKAGSRIDSYSVIGRNCSILGADIKRSILWDCVSAGSGASIRGSIVCSRVRLGRGCNVYENAIIGDDCIIGNYSEVRPRIRIWPSKCIDEDSVVSRDLIWSEGVKSTIFGDLGISGRINEDITPEFLCSLGAAYASIAGSEIAVGYTAGSAGQMLANAATAGVMSAGVFVHDAGACALPVMRFVVRELNLSGAILIECDEGFARIHILDRYGSDITRKTEKKIETAFFRNDGKRCDYHQIKYCRDLENAALFYTRALIRKCAPVKERPVRVVLGGRGKLRDMDGDILRRLGCDVFYIEDDTCDELAAYRINRLRADLAAFFRNDDDFSLYDGTGTRLGESTLRMLKYTLVCETHACSALFLPANESGQAEDFLKNYGVKVERTKTNVQDLMAKIWASEDTPEQKETYFGIMFDPIEFLVRLVQVLSARNITLSKLAASLPESRVLMTTVQCPSKYKGRVIRTLAESQGRKEFYDGVKIYEDNGWALVLPENDKPVCKVYTSAFTEEYASELAIKYSEIIKRITEENE